MKDPASRTQEVLRTTIYDSLDKFCENYQTSEDEVQRKKVTESVSRMINSLRTFDDKEKLSFWRYYRQHRT